MADSSDPTVPIPSGKPEARTVREGSFGWMIQTIAAAMNARLDVELGPLGLTRHQFGVLMILLDIEGISQADIGKRINLPGYATTRGMDALEALDLVQRRPDATSRRAYKVYLTAKGRALGPTLFEIVKRVNGGMAEGLSADQKDALHGGLTIMAGNARKA
ncbi:MAG: DNA-binding MarR family transcriptional regulator [Sulfitobacter sp.]|jgi:DNA-binding MarR family transcriptional regulator